MVLFFLISFSVCSKEMEENKKLSVRAKESDVINKENLCLLLIERKIFLKCVTLFITAY